MLHATMHHAGDFTVRGNNSYYPFMPSFHGYNHIDTNSTIAIGDTISNTILHYNLMIHKKAFGTYCFKTWKCTQLYIYMFSSSLGESGRSYKISGADGVGNLVPSSCYACVIGYR